MPEPSITDFLIDPLGEVTRKERRNLLISSVVGVLVRSLGLVPSKVSALGIELSAPAQKYFVFLVAAVVFYFLLAFVVYGWSDWLVWWKKYQDYRVAAAIEFENWSQQDQERYDELHTRVPKAAWLYVLSKPAAFTRIAFEFVLPPLAGTFSLCLLLQQA